jgi:hypothetical protein
MNSTTNSGQNQPDYHPSFSFPDADLVFASSNGVLFKAHSLVLRLASSFFRDMLTIPRDAHETESFEPIPVAENGQVFEAFLALIYPSGSNDVALTLSYEDFCDLLLVITQKYTLDAGQTLAKGLFNDSRLAFSPTQKLQIAERMEWRPEAEAASKAVHNASVLATRLGTAPVREIRGWVIYSHRTSIH